MFLNIEKGFENKIIKSYLSLSVCACVFYVCVCVFYVCECASKHL